MIIKPDNIIIMNNKMAIKWNDGSESLIDNKLLRKQCPCANWAGESDIFGNLYQSNTVKIDNQDQYSIIHYINIGHYAIRIIWKDGHNAGIYSFKFLKAIGD